MKVNRHSPPPLKQERSAPLSPRVWHEEIEGLRLTDEVAKKRDDVAVDADSLHMEFAKLTILSGFQLYRVYRFLRPHEDVKLHLTCRN